MTVYSHDTQVEYLEVREITEIRPSGLTHVVRTDRLKRVTQSNGDIEYLVYFGGGDPFGFDAEAEARRFFAA